MVRRRAEQPGRPRQRGGHRLRRPQPQLAYFDYKLANYITLALDGGFATQHLQLSSGNSRSIALAVDGQNRLYVAQSQAGTIALYVVDGHYRKGYAERVAGLASTLCDEAHTCNDGGAQTCIEYGGGSSCIEYGGGSSCISPYSYCASEFVQTSGRRRSMSPRWMPASPRRQGPRAAWTAAAIRPSSRPLRASAGAVKRRCVRVDEAHE
jgi:hypothetical protein